MIHFLVVKKAFMAMEFGGFVLLASIRLTRRLSTSMATSTTEVGTSTTIWAPSVTLCTSIFKSSDVRSSIYPARLRAGDLTKLQLFINLICKLSQSCIQPFSGAFLFGKPTMDRQQHFTVFKSVIQSLFLIRNPNKPALALPIRRNCLPLL